MLVGWTGHRPGLFRSPEEARKGIERMADAALARWSGATFVCGGQRGVDTWAAQAALARGIPFWVVLPARPEPFTEGWEDADRDLLAALMTRAADVRIVGEAPPLPNPPSPGGRETSRAGPLAYDRRNEIVAKESDLLIAVWTGLRQGGTFYTLCAAHAFGTPVESTILAPASGIFLAGRGV
jgi:hypothetical protein